MLLKRAVLCAFLALGCSPCGGGNAVAGDTPFERCIASEPMAPAASIGNVKLRLRDRVLSLDGLPATTRIAVFQGPGMATQLGHADAIRRLTAATPDILLVLGGIGMESLAAEPWLPALLKVGRPVLFLPGGRDSIASVEGALKGLPRDLRQRFVDLTGIYVVNLPGYMLALVSGADSGRAAIAENACGFSDTDVDAVRDALDDGGERAMVLVSWEIPAGGQGSRLAAASVGSEHLKSLREHGRFKAGVYAWPDTDVMRPVAASGAAFVWGEPSASLEVVVPRIAGPAHERSDGTRQLPGFVVLRLESGAIVPEMPR